MFAFPVSDTSAVALNHTAKKTWRCHWVDFEPLRVDRLETPRFPGPVSAGALNPRTSAVWVRAKHELVLISRKSREAFVAAVPDNVTVFDITFVSGRCYLACSKGKVWTYDLDVEDWVLLLDHVREHPNFYKTIPVGEDLYFVGEAGRIVRFRGPQFDELHLEGNPRLITGSAEGNALIVGSDAGAESKAQIFKGTLDGGFEPIFQHEHPALHMSALHDGIRYIGAGGFDPYRSLFMRPYPALEGPALFTWNGTQLTPVQTGCVREPETLAQLVCTGSTLWAIDAGGIFRLTAGRWSLTEWSELHRAAFAPPVAP